MLCGLLLIGVHVPCVSVYGCLDEVRGLPLSSGRLYREWRGASMGAFCFWKVVVVCRV